MTAKFINEHKVTGCYVGKTGETCEVIPVSALEGNAIYDPATHVAVPIEHCADCSDQGWYMVKNNLTGETEKVQCAWCDIVPTSAYNVRKAILSAEEEG